MLLDGLPEVSLPWQATSDSPRPEERPEEGEVGEGHEMSRSKGGEHLGISIQHYLRFSQPIMLQIIMNFENSVHP